MSRLMCEFVGFNDMVPWSSVGDDRLLLATTVYQRPPVDGDRAEVRVLRGDKAIVSLGETNCWNFPQGARQQWLHGGEEVVFNARENGIPCAWVVGITRRTRRKLRAHIYALSPLGGEAFGLNFGRMQRLGGYGYAGLGDETAGSAAPENDGIWSVPLDGSEPRLLLSIAEVADFAATRRIHRNGHHYLTHVLPSPSGKQLAFLHRSWLPDGGLNTRLLIWNLAEKRLRLWAEGYLSHFDWRNEETIVIWGRAGQELGRLRQQAGLLGLIPRPLLRLAKDIVRPVLGGSSVFRCHYLILRETDEPGKQVALGPGILASDGHPSFLPIDRSWMLSDTYPDSAGWRELFLLDCNSLQKIEIGRFQECREKVDTSRLHEAVLGIDQVALQNFNPKVFAYNRSGLYCDLHPRWRGSGREVCFDSNHEGHRGIYSVTIPSEILIRKATSAAFQCHAWN